MTDAYPHIDVDRDPDGGSDAVLYCGICHRVRIVRTIGSETDYRAALAEFETAHAHGERQKGAA